MKYVVFRLQAVRGIHPLRQSIMTCELPLYPSRVLHPLNQIRIFLPISEYEAMVDSYISDPSSDLPNENKILSLPRSSVHLLILLELNIPHVRSDPWNPAPRVMHAVERDDTVYVFLEKSSQWDDPPLKRIGDYIDFFRQILEVCGLVPFGLWYDKLF